jgi:hypothetical protein
MSSFGRRLIALTCLLNKPAKINTLFSGYNEVINLPDVTSCTVTLTLRCASTLQGINDFNQLEVQTSKKTDIFISRPPHTPLGHRHPHFGRRFGSLEVNFCVDVDLRPIRRDDDGRK